MGTNQQVALTKCHFCGREVTGGRFMPGGHLACAPCESALAVDVTKTKLTTRITAYLSNGGLFNPELMEHNKVRDLLMGCRSELERLGRKLKKLQREHRKLSEDYAKEII